MNRTLASAAIAALMIAGLPATASGSELRVVLYSDLRLEGDLDKPYEVTDESVCTYAFECTDLMRTAKALHRYFEGRTPAGGKEVRMFAVRSLGGIGSPCAERHLDARIVQEAFEPDLVAIATSGAECFADEITEAGIPVFSLTGFHDQRYQDAAPLLWSYGPSLDTSADIAAGFMCRKLHGLPARFSGPVSAEASTRKFGLVHPIGSQRGDAFQREAEALIAEVSARCGLEFLVTPLIVNDLQDGFDQAVEIMEGFKRQGITTVTCFCIPVPTEMAVTKLQAAATALQYTPEWFWPVGMSSMFSQRLFRANPGGSFGLTSTQRVSDPDDTDWYQAFYAEEPGATPNDRFIWSLYHTMLVTYAAIEAGAPTHSPTAIRDGLFGFTVGDPDDPFSASGAFGPDSGNPYSLIDTAMAYWWDDTGSSPGGAPSTGCLRAVNGGLRTTGADWSAGDADLFVPSDPCTQSVSRILIF